MPLKTGKILSILLVVLAFSRSALAEPALPPGKWHDIDGKSYMCYDLTGFKQLVLLAMERNKLVVDVNTLTKQMSLLRDITGLQEKVIAVRDQQVALIKGENERMFKLWQEENKKRHDAEERPDWSAILGWGTAGVFAVSTAVLVGVVALD